MSQKSKTVNWQSKIGNASKDGGQTAHPRSVILQTLSQRGALTLDELARVAQRSPLATRYHVGLLVAEGLLMADDAARDARVGRPPRVYALTARAHARLPQQVDWLVAQMLDEWADALSEKKARARLRRIGRRLAALAPLARSTRLGARLTRAVDFLSARGYPARWEKDGGDYVVRVAHCPYAGVAQTHPMVCEIDLALFGALMQVSFKLTQCLARQDAECVFVIQR